MAVPMGDECAPLLAAALERGGKLAPLACPVCPSLVREHGPGAPRLYLDARLGQVPPELANIDGGLHGGGCFGVTEAHRWDELSGAYFSFAPGECFAGL